MSNEEREDGIIAVSLLMAGPGLIGLACGWRMIDFIKLYGIIAGPMVIAGIYVAILPTLDVVSEKLRPIFSPVFQQLWSAVKKLLLIGAWLWVAVLAIGALWLITSLLPTAGPVVIPAWAFVFLVLWACNSRCSN